MASVVSDLAVHPRRARTAIGPRPGFVAPLAGGVIVVDQATKALVSNWSFNAGPLTLSPVESAGALVRPGSGSGGAVALAAAICIGLVLVLARRVPAAAVGVTLVVAGAASSLLERIVRADGIGFDGPVVDIVRIWSLPATNVADVAMLAGLWIAARRIVRSPS